jgi:hypothetical protein
MDHDLILEMVEDGQKRKQEDVLEHKLNPLDIEDTVLPEKLMAVN